MLFGNIVWSHFDDKKSYLTIIIDNDIFIPYVYLSNECINFEDKILV